MFRKAAGMMCVLLVVLMITVMISGARIRKPTTTPAGDDNPEKVVAASCKYDPSLCDWSRYPTSGDAVEQAPSEGWSQEPRQWIRSYTAKP